MSNIVWKNFWQNNIASSILCPVKLRIAILKVQGHNISANCE